MKYIALIDIGMLIGSEFMLRFAHFHNIFFLKLIIRVFSNVKIFTTHYRVVLDNI